MRAVVVYVAGPLHTSGIEHKNVRAAIDAAERLAQGGVVPIVPHLTAAQWALLHPERSGDEWLEMDLALLERCDAVLRIAGESKGADAEVERARALGMPVYFEPGMPGVRGGVWEILSDAETGVLVGRAEDDLSALDVLQARHNSWLCAMGQSGRSYHLQLMGLTEELGELNRALLKQEQAIRGESQEHEAAAMDALGDLMLFALGLCNARHWDLSTIIEQTAAKVFARTRRDFEAKHRRPEVA